MKKWIWLELLCCFCGWSSSHQLLQQHWNADHSHPVELILQTDVWSSREQLVRSLVNPCQSENASISQKMKRYFKTIVLVMIKFYSCAKFIYDKAYKVYSFK